MPVYSTNASHDRFSFGIIEMPTVPSEEIIDTMYSGYGNMQGVIQSLRRKGFLLEKCFGQCDNSICNWQYGHIG